MSVNVTKTRTPVQFELIENALDDRFQRVKIKIAHTGENLNNSYFSKETLDSMKPTLANIPIVGFIEKNEDNEDDFRDHRQEITVQDGDVKIRYAGHAYGFIPEDNKADFEISGGKEWLVCEGYLWTKFRDAMDIFKDANGVKSQSMEIQDITGGADDLGRLVISSGRFSALCILGDDVAPAMTGSTVQLYSAKINNSEVNEMMVEFAESKRKKGGDGNVDEETEVIEDVKEHTDEHTGDLSDKDTKSENAHIDGTDGDVDGAVSDSGVHGDVSVPADEHGAVSVVEHAGVDTGHVAEESNTAEELGGVEHHDDVQEESGVEEPESPAVDGETHTETQDDTSHVEEAEVDEQEGDSETFTQIIGNKEFQLSHSDIRSKLHEAIDKLAGEDEYAYIDDVFSDHAILHVSNWSEDTRRYLRVEYSELDNSIVLGESSEIFPMFLSEQEKTRIENERVQIEQLNAQLQELIEYRNEIEYSKKQEIVKEFSEIIGEDKVSEIELKFSTLSIEDVEREVAFVVYQAKKESDVQSYAEAVASPATNFNKSATNGRYGSLDAYFNK